MCLTHSMTAMKTVKLVKLKVGKGSWYQIIVALKVVVSVIDCTADLAKTKKIKKVMDVDIKLLLLFLSLVRQHNVVQVIVIADIAKLGK